jgi:hypothetical protein
MQAEQLPLGEAAVGWGFWEFYPDIGKWYRTTVHHYDESEKKYRVREQ